MKKGQEPTLLEPCHWTEGPVIGRDNLSSSTSFLFSFLTAQDIINQN